MLRKRGVDEEEVAQVLVRLLESGGLDDERFARSYAEDKRELEGWGPERIRGALLARGLSEELVDAALGAEDEPAQVERAVRVLAQRDARCDSDQARSRALALLARRGYPLEVAYEAVRKHERRAA